MPFPGPLPEFKTDHFKFYLVKVDRNPRHVPFSLRGQFEEALELPPQPHSVGRIEYLGNPVSKNHRRIQNRRTHLDWYPLLGEPEPQRTVSIQNQFGEDVFDLGDPELMLVPALKSEEEDEPKPPTLPADVSHFKGYKILRQEPFEHDKIFLKDQFDPEIEPPSLFALSAPTHFCLPVAKFVAGEVWPMLNPAEHLTIYPITQHPSGKGRRVWDQFDGGMLQVIKSVFLAVPTVKGPFPTPDEAAAR